MGGRVNQERKQKHDAHNASSTVVFDREPATDSSNSLLFFYMLTLNGILAVTIDSSSLRDSPVQT
jgi:hypothetical protein